MLLGQILKRLGDETFAAETLVSLDDLALMVQVEITGRRFAEDIGAYAAGASLRFAHHASDEEWLALMTALERADDPGAACLRHMLIWSLRQDTEHPDVGCGSGYCTCKGS